MFTIKGTLILAMSCAPRRKSPDEEVRVYVPEGRPLNENEYVYVIVTPVDRPFATLIEDGDMLTDAWAKDVTNAIKITAVKHLRILMGSLL
jgi:hypothetical protein